MVFKIRSMLTFLNKLDSDLRKALMAQIRNLWTHSSTAIEGNSLTLGETAFVLEEGLTVAGKPLRDHEEVVGHAKAIDLLYAILRDDRNLTREDLFALHRAVQTEAVFDVYKPLGRWKNQPNSTAAVVNGTQVIFEYALPEDVPKLMEMWFNLFNKLEGSVKPQDWEAALDAYVSLHVSFVRIHPFFDGNGRLARLVANLPVLKAGLPPIVVPREQRQQYIKALSDYHYAMGQVRAGDDLLPQKEKLQSFTDFCRQAWQVTRELVEAAHERQRQREKL